jgi:magnesium transporter
MADRDHRGHRSDPPRERPLNGGLRARLFDADGNDQDFDPAEGIPTVGQTQLVWVDLDLDAGASLDDVAERLPLSATERGRIEADTGRAGLSQGAARLDLTVEALEPEDPDDDESRLIRREVDLLAVPGMVVSVHRGTVLALDRFAASLADDTLFGVLQAGDLLSALVDEVIDGYFHLAERLEGDIDLLDERALRGDPDDDVLAEIVAIRRRIGFIRRTLAPHRTALSALARPEMEIEDGLGRPWPGLTDRIDAALGNIESLRDALLGTYDIHMGRVSQRANDVMKTLTLLSAVLLPAVVLAGVMGMNFKVSFFDEPGNFFYVVGAMAVFAIGLLAVARWRRWW